MTKLKLLATRLEAVGHQAFWSVHAGRRVGVRGPPRLEQLEREADSDIGPPDSVGRQVAGYAERWHEISGFKAVGNPLLFQQWDSHVHAKAVHRLPDRPEVEVVPDLGQLRGRRN